MHEVVLQELQKSDVQSVEIVDVASEYIANLGDTEKGRNEASDVEKMLCKFKELTNG
jgi:hypothetical protein